MSETVNRQGIGFIYKSNKIDDEVKDYLINKLGEPDYIEKYNENYYIEYKGWEITRAKSGILISKIFNESEDYGDSEFKMTFKDITEQVENLARNFHINKNDIIIYSVSYYNGSDCPMIKW